MVDNLDDLRRDTENLTKALSLLSETNTSAARTFGQLGSTTGKFGRAWTIVSRITSGSGFWQIQNRLRSVSNVFELFTNASDAAAEKNMKALKSNFELAESLRRLKKEQSELKKTPLYLMFKEDTDAVTAAIEANKIYEKTIGRVQKRVDERKKAFRKSIAPSIFTRLNREGLATALFGKKYKGGQFMPGGEQARKGGQREGFFKQQKRNISAVFDFAKKGLVFFGKFLLFTTALTLGLFLLIQLFKNTKPLFEKFFERLSGVFETLSTAFSAILPFFQALYDGKFFTALKLLLVDILGNIVLAIGKLTLSIGQLIVGIILKGINRIFAKVASTFRSVKKEIRNSLNPFKRGRQAGGIVSEGMTLVGENGPELVRLPMGSRVYSNANSRGMVGGTTNITVQVTGRVGASDMEIRDIAQKVSREIGLQMNRTGSTAVRF
jgi:hypothetical protein